MVLESYNHNNSQGISNVSTEDSFLVNSNHSYLLNMYDCLSNTLIHFCHLVSEYLSCLDNCYDILAEYNVRVSEIQILKILILSISGGCTFAACWKLKRRFQPLQNYSIKHMEPCSKDTRVFRNFRYGG